jgi:hypothetical protein
VLVFTSPLNIVDRALVIIAALFVLDTVVRVVLFDIIFKSSDALAAYNSSKIHLLRVNQRRRFGALLRIGSARLYPDGPIDPLSPSR